jgi:hypothetical protein
LILILIVFDVCVDVIFGDVQFDVVF